MTTTERTYYDQDGVLVTTSRFVAGGQTYPLGQIASVSLAKIPKKTGCATTIMVVCGGAAMIALISGVAGVEWGTIAAGIVFLFFAIAGWLLLQQAHDQYAVQVTTSSGEQRLVVSKDPTIPSAVIDALGEALVDRDSR